MVWTETALFLAGFQEGAEFSAGAMGAGADLFGGHVEEVGDFLVGPALDVVKVENEVAGGGDLLVEGEEGFPDDGDIFGGGFVDIGGF